MSAPNTIGEPVPRADGHSKVTGAARYSGDVPVADLAHAVLVTSTVARGRAVSFETAEAERLEGVLAILTPRNAMRLPGGESAAASNDRAVQALQDDRILYSGQPIALAVADTFEHALYAALRVRVREVAEPATVRLDDELARAFPHDIMRAGGKQPADQVHGDVERGFAAAQVRVDATYEIPQETHNPMEPHATVAVWTGRDRVTLYDATQGVFNVRKKIAKAFALDPGNVRVVTKFVGGGFGCKGSAWSHVVLAALAARQLARPVKLVLLRQQMFSMVGGRPRIRQRLSLAATRDGKLTAMSHASISTTSRFDEFLEPAATVSRHAYACENIATSHRLVRLDIGTPTYMRAPGESSGSFALESAMDELAVALRMDPVELRLRNYAEVDPTEGKPFSSKSLRQCYAEGARRFDWERRKAAPRSVRRDGLLVGLGMATASYPANQSPASASARLEPDGTVVVESGAVDIGTGTYTVMAQVAAEELGVPLARVRFDLGDTEMPEAPVSGGSQTAASVSAAVALAARALRERLVELAVADARSPLHGAAPASVRCEAGVLRAGAHAEPLAALARRAGAVIEVRADSAVLEERKRYATHAFGAQFAEVLVDPDLLTVRVARLVGVFAAGRILNARLARSQFMGGMVWGIGMALHEHTVYDERLGRVMSHDLADYHVPVHADVRGIEPHFLEVEPDPHVNIVGVKGIGEIGITGVAAAIANAVYDATGIRVRDLPITPDKLLAT